LRYDINNIAKIVESNIVRHKTNNTFAIVLPKIILKELGITQENVDNNSFVWCISYNIINENIGSKVINVIAMSQKDILNYYNNPDFRDKVILSVKKKRGGGGGVKPVSRIVKEEENKKDKEKEMEMIIDL
jgi:hypothetical protein